MDLTIVATFFLLVFFQGGGSEAPACAREGELVCGGCATLGVCVAGGRWLAVRHCAREGQVCWEGACVDAAAAPAACAGEAVGCFAQGAFPRLDDCSRYVECAGEGVGEGVGVTRSCPAGTRFDACTGRCDVLASGGACAWQLAPGAACARPGLFGVAPGNDRLYYTCVATADGTELRWSRCELGHFDTQLLRCVDLDVPGCKRNEDGTVTTPTPTPTPTPSTTSESSTPTTTVDSNQCKAGSAYPNPSTNCNYFFCQPDGEYLQIFCNGGAHFDITEGMCVSGQCENFLEGMSKSEDET